jgi:hypothetical protein
MFKSERETYESVIGHLNGHIDRLERTIDTLMVERMHYLGAGQVPARIEDEVGPTVRVDVPLSPEPGEIVSDINRV